MPESLTVSNSSCLIALDAAGSLGILERLYCTISVPDAIAQECGRTLPSWVRADFVQNQALARSLRLNLGAGEAEAIALSIERSAARLILDDRGSGGLHVSSICPSQNARRLIQRQGAGNHPQGSRNS